MGPIWGRQDPGGPHVGPMNFVIWAPLTGVFSSQRSNNADILFSLLTGWTTYWASSPCWWFEKPWGSCDVIVMMLYWDIHCNNIEALFWIRASHQLGEKPLCKPITTQFISSYKYQWTAKIYLTPIHSQPYMTIDNIQVFCSGNSRSKK